MESYLSELKAHYNRDSADREIISDIEERIAELLIEKTGKENVVSKQHIAEIINTLGRPSEIDSDNDSEKNPKQAATKKLYRDLENKKIGGVCSGLSHYLKIDPVIVRLAFFVLMILLFVIEEIFGNRYVYTRIGSLFHWSTLPIIIYLILWIVMPGARTVAQKCAMKGISLGLEDIEKESYSYSSQQDYYNVRKENKRSVLGDFLRILGRIIIILFGIFMIFTGIAGLITGLYVVFGVNISPGFPVMEAIDYIALNISTTFWIKILALFTYFIPCILLIYWGMMCCFKFREPSWRPGMILFLSWIVIAIAFVVISIIAAKPFMQERSSIKEMVNLKQYDTLYVRFADKPADQATLIDLTERRYKYHLNYVEKIHGEKSNLQFTVYPELRIYRDDSLSHSSVYCKAYYFTDRNVIFNARKRFKTEDIVSVRDSLITVYPQKINKEHKYTGDSYRIVFELPQNGVVRILDKEYDASSEDRFGIPKND